MPSPSFVRNSNWSSKAPLPSAESIDRQPESSRKRRIRIFSNAASSFSYIKRESQNSPRSPGFSKYTSPRPDPNGGEEAKVFALCIDF